MQALLNVSGIGGRDIAMIDEFLHFKASSISMSTGITSKEAGAVRSYKIVDEKNIACSAMESKLSGFIDSRSSELAHLAKSFRLEICLLLDKDQELGICYVKIGPATLRQLANSEITLKICFFEDGMP